MAVVAGGCIAGIGMFNALVMSYTRLPMAMAEDGMLPRALALRNRRGVPWVSVFFCGMAWALALKLPFERLISIDLILYGSSLLLEFLALAVLRLREPQLSRPFKAGNLAFACSLGIGPAALISYALYVSRDPNLIGSLSPLLFATIVGLLGPVLYWLTASPLVRRARTQTRVPGSLSASHSSLFLATRVFRLGLSKLLGGDDNAVAGIGRITPTLHLHPLALQILVDREKVRDLLQHVRIDIGVVPDVCEAGIVFPYCQDLFVEDALVQHLQQTDGADLLDAARKAGTRHQHQHVQRVAVVA